MRFSLAGLASPLCVYVCACTCKSACNLSVGSAPIALRAGAQLAALAQGKLLQLRLACVHPQLTQYWKTLSNELQLHQARASVHACCKLVCTCVCMCAGVTKVQYVAMHLCCVGGVCLLSQPKVYEVFF